MCVRHPPVCGDACRYAQQRTRARANENKQREKGQRFGARLARPWPPFAAPCHTLSTFGHLYTPSDDDKQHIARHRPRARSTGKAATQRPQSTANIFPMRRIPPSRLLRPERGYLTPHGARSPSAAGKSTQLESTALTWGGVGFVYLCARCPRQQCPAAPARSAAVASAEPPRRRRLLRTQTGGARSWRAAGRAASARFMNVLCCRLCEHNVLFVFKYDGLVTPLRPWHRQAPRSAAQERPVAPWRAHGLCVRLGVDGSRHRLLR